MAVSTSQRHGVARGSHLQIFAARALGALRAAIGVSALVAPSLVATPWVGRREAERASVMLFARTLGGRDLALGYGAMMARSRHGALKSWVLLGALADCGDFLATIAAFRSLPRIRRWLILALTAGAAVAGAAIGLSLEGEES